MYPVASRRCSRSARSFSPATLPSSIVVIPSLIRLLRSVARVSAQRDPGPSALLAFNHDSSLLIRIHLNAPLVARTRGSLVLWARREGRSGAHWSLPAKAASWPRETFWVQTRGREKPSKGSNRSGVVRRCWAGNKTRFWPSQRAAVPFCPYLWVSESGTMTDGTVLKGALV